MTEAASRLTCTFGFQHPNAGRKTCGLPVLVERPGHEPLCPWHHPDARPADFNVKQELEKELQSPDHWLEGAKLAMQDLRNLSAREGRLPGADFEGARLDKALLHKAILDDAFLVSAQMPAATLSYASLVGAKLDLAQLAGADLAYCNLSGARLHGTKLDGATLFGIKLTAETVFLGVVWGTPGELLHQQFEKATSVFRVVRSHFRSQSNMREAEEFYFWEMTAFHLRAINADFDPEHNSWQRRWRRWLPGNRRLDKWIGWALHRWGWGYGVRPLYTVGWMLFVWLLFGLAIYPVVGIQSGENVTHDVPSALALSAVTFTTLGYGNRSPCGTIGECFGGLEALLGALLISVFVVALATKYVYVS